MTLSPSSPSGPTRPASAESSLPPFCCPVCKGPLAEEPERYQCAACARDYPIVLGIPDFRVYPDPYIDYADDHAKAGRLAAESNTISFERLSERYWEMTPGTLPHLARRYVRHALGGVERGRSSLAVLRRAASALGRASRPTASFLEVGCGSGGFLVAAAQQYDDVVGIDIAFRWLILARKRVDEAVERGDLTPEQAARLRIVCCCAEYLPFPNGSFDLLVASDVIEHTAYQEQFVRQSRGALRPGGLLFLATPNRFSLTPEPHVQVWGVGFLPRRLMGRYVRLVRGIGYEHIWTVSAAQLAGLLRRAGFARWTILLPRLTDAEIERYSRPERLGIHVYHRLIDLPVFRDLLYLCGPFFQVVAVAPGAGRE